MQTSGRSSAKSSRYGPDETSLGTIRCSLGWAGPAGLLAAGKAAESGAKVVVIEKMRQPGRKLLITGNGRSNITNSSPMSELMSHVHPNGKYLRQAFLQFSSADMIALLKELELENHKVELRFNCRVTELKISEGKVTGLSSKIRAVCSRSTHAQLSSARAENPTWSPVLQETATSRPKRWATE